MFNALSQQSLQHVSGMNALFSIVMRYRKLKRRQTIVQFACVCVRERCLVRVHVQNIAFGMTFFSRAK